MWYIRSRDTDRYYTRYENGCLIWKDHSSRALYSSDRYYLQGVVDTLCNVLDIGIEEFEIVWEDE